MGWSPLTIVRRNPLFRGIRKGAHFYFVHSYYAASAEPADVAATTDYGLVFTASVRRDNIYACQFHPEKSQKLGLALLSNFGDVVRCS